MSHPTTDVVYARADVYRNLLRKCVSVSVKGKVIARAQSVVVTDVTFRVQPAGIARIRRRHEREIVAYARGNVVELSDELLAIPAGARRVCFDPFKHDGFTLDDGSVVTHADMLIMHSPCGSYVVNPR